MLSDLNDLLDAQERYNDRLRDATALGLSSSLANQELALSLRSIVLEAELSADQIKDLAGAFPELSKQLLSLIGLAGNNDTAKALADAESRKAEAEAELRRAYEEQRSTLDGTISRLKAFTESIKEFRDSLKVDNSLSPLGPYDRFLEAQKQFRETSALAMTGDEDAMDRLQDVSREYLDEARSYYASSEAYFAAFNEVQRILDQSLASAGDQLTEAEKQLEQLKKQVGALIDIDDGVKSVADAIREFKAAEAAVAAAKAADDAYKNDLFRQMIALLAQQQSAAAAAEAARKAAEGAAGGGAGGSAYSASDPIANAYRQYLKREPDAQGYAFWAGNLASGRASIDQIIADIRKQAGFALGGYTGDMARNAVAGVVHGQEFVMNAAATQRWRPQFEAINRGGTWPVSNDNSAVVAELRASNVELLKELRAVKAAIAAAGLSTVEAVEKGNDLQAENVSQQRRANSR